MIARSYCDETLPNSRRQTVDKLEIALDVNDNDESEFSKLDEKG